MTISKGTQPSTRTVSEGAQRHGKRLQTPREDRAQNGNHPWLGTEDAGLPTQGTGGRTAKAPPGWMCARHANGELRRGEKD